MFVIVYIAYVLSYEDKKLISSLFQSKLKDLDEYVIFHETEYIHSTISFIGKTNVKDINRIKSEIAKINIENVSLNLTGRLDILGGSGKPVLVAKLAKDDTITGIHSQVLAKLAKLGIEANMEYEYNPHISLGKFTSDTDFKNLKLPIINLEICIKPLGIGLYKTIDYSKII